MLIATALIYEGLPDAGELAKAALLESLSVQLYDKLPSLLEPTPQEIRRALASFASDDAFNAGRQATQRVPSGDRPPPRTMTCTCGWWGFEWGASSAGGLCAAAQIN